MAIKIPRTSTGPLPEEILYCILLRLPLRDLSRFRHVSKSWKALISSPSFARDVEASPSCEREEGIIFTVEDHLHLYTPHKKSWKATKSLKIPREDLILVSSCNGLLLFLHTLEKNQLFICNPFTSEFVSLPLAKREKNCDKWALVHDARSNKFKVFGISSHGYYLCLTQDDTRWIELEIQNQSTIISKLFFFNSELHSVIIDIDDDHDDQMPKKFYFIVSLHVETGASRRTKIETQQADPEEVKLYELRNHLLAQVNGSLCLAVVTPFQLYILVEKRNSCGWILQHIFHVHNLRYEYDAPRFIERRFKILLQTDMCLVATGGKDVCSALDIFKYVLHHGNWFFIYDFSTERWSKTESLSKQDLFPSSEFYNTSIFSWKGGM